MFIVELFSDLLSDTLHHRDWVWQIISGFMLLLFVGIGLLIAVGVLSFLYWIYTLIFYVSAFGPAKLSNGKVTDMKYTASKTTYSYSATTKTIEGIENDQ